MKKDLQEAIEIIRQGGVIIFPTDTAFGIGCRMDNEKAVKRLFKIRQRPETQATPVLVNSIEMAQKYLQPIENNVKNLMKKHWPGALTIIYPCQPQKTLPFVRGGGLNLGVRIPNHEVPLVMIKNIDVPILGPSANFHGQKTPYEFKDLDKQLVKLVDYVIPGECLVRQASTVINCSVKPWKIIRQGAIRV